MLNLARKEIQSNDQSHIQTQNNILVNKEISLWDHCSMLMALLLS